MSQLFNTIEGIYSSVKGESTNIYSEYEKIPVIKHEAIYAVLGVSKIVIEEGYWGESTENYSEKFKLDIKILASANFSPQSLYNMLDVIIDRLTAGGYILKYAEISSPSQDNSLKRMVLKCYAEILGRAEG